MAKKTAENETEKTNVPEKVEPRRELSPFEEMERLFDDFLPRHWMRRWGWPDMGWPAWESRMGLRMPRVDVIDRDEAVVIKAELPGVEKDQLDISLTGDSVTIKGETRKEEREEKGDYFRSEIHRGSFTRTIALPAEVDGEKATATFKDGVLELKLPKVAQTTRRKVKIEG